MEEFTLMNKQRNRIKIFKPFEDISKPSPTIKAVVSVSSKLSSSETTGAGESA